MDGTLNEHMALDEQQRQVSDHQENTDDNGRDSFAGKFRRKMITPKTIRDQEESSSEAEEDKRT